MWYLKFLKHTFNWYFQLHRTINHLFHLS